MFKCLGIRGGGGGGVSIDKYGSIPMAIPMAIPVNSIQVENGTAYINSNIKCYYKLNANIQGKWYYGVITDINNSTCDIVYKDAGFSVTCHAGEDVYLIKNKNI